jgi:hypothetical protein
MEIDTMLRVDGSGTMNLVVRDLNEARASKVEKALISPATKITEKEFRDGTARYVIEFKDIAKLRSAPLFRELRATHTLAGNKKTLVLTLPRHDKSTEPRSKTPTAKTENPEQTVLAVRFDLPGKIVETNADSKTERQATWQFRRKAFEGRGTIGMRVVYELPPTPDPGAAPPKPARSPESGSPRAIPRATSAAISG